MLSRAGPDPRALADGPGPLQGLHLHSQAQRLSVAAHLGHPRFQDADRNPDPRQGDARPGRARARRPLGLQGGQAGRRLARPVDRRAGRDPRPCRQPRGVARAHPDGDVPGSYFRLHPQGRAHSVTEGRHPGRLRLCRPHRIGRPDRRRQGQRPGGAAAHLAREWRPGRNPRLRGPAPAAELAALRRHRQGTLVDPPLRPPQGAGRDHRARQQDLRRDRRPPAGAAGPRSAWPGDQEIEAGGCRCTDDRHRPQAHFRRSGDGGADAGIGRQRHHLTPAGAAAGDLDQGPDPGRRLSPRRMLPPDPRRPHRRAAP